MARRGFLVSAAAIATLSTPANEKTAEIKILQVERNFPRSPLAMVLLTKGPGSLQYLKPTRSTPGTPPRFVIKPKRNKPMIVMILITAKANSASPNHRILLNPTAAVIKIKTTMKTEAFTSVQ
jgi:hypothetical protein